MTFNSTLLARLTGPLLFLSAIVLGFGCTGSGNPEETTTEPAQEDSVAAAGSTLETTTVAAIKTTNLTSPATAGGNEPAAESTPKQVCQQFMKLLQSGNRIAAENLLTRAALTTTTRAGLVLEPMGGATAVYTVTDVRYATTQQKLAQVECLVSDSENGEQFEMPITWFVRKQRTGWRISGVMLELEPGQALDLLSFENIYDVTKMKNLAGGEVLDGADVTRQADADPTASNIK